jgi:hypothetical protein
MFLSMTAGARATLRKSIDIEVEVFLNNAYLTSERNAGLAYGFYRSNCKVNQVKPSSTPVRNLLIFIACHHLISPSWHWLLQLAQTLHAGQ